jgi:predicted GNAT family acetyltransferase
MNPFNDIASAQVVHNSAAQQFELRVGDLLCLLQYRMADTKMIIFHTEVPPAVQNRGLAERMTQAALEFARAHKLKVEPRCPYTAAFLRRYRGYSDLL